jgi:hypothetical protein
LDETVGDTSALFVDNAGHCAVGLFVELWWVKVVGMVSHLKILDEQALGVLSIILL